MYKPHHLISEKWRSKAVILSIKVGQLKPVGVQNCRGGASEEQKERGDNLREWGLDAQ